MKSTKYPSFCEKIGSFLVKISYFSVSWGQISAKSEESYDNKTTASTEFNNEASSIRIRGDPIH